MTGSQAGTSTCPPAILRGRSGSGSSERFLGKTALLIGFVISAGRRVGISAQWNDRAVRLDGYEALLYTAHGCDRILLGLRVGFCPSESDRTSIRSEPGTKGARGCW